MPSLFSPMTVCGPSRCIRAYPTLAIAPLSHDQVLTCQWVTSFAMCLPSLPVFTHQSNVLKVRDCLQMLGIHTLWFKAVVMNFVIRWKLPAEDLVCEDVGSQAFVATNADGSIATTAHSASPNPASVLVKDHLSHQPLLRAFKAIRPIRMTTEEPARFALYPAAFPVGLLGDLGWQSTSAFAEFRSRVIHGCLPVRGGHWGRGVSAPWPSFYRMASS